MWISSAPSTRNTVVSQLPKTCLDPPHQSEELLLLSQGDGFSLDSYSDTPVVLVRFSHKNNYLDQGCFGKLRIYWRWKMQPSLTTETLILTLRVQMWFLWTVLGAAVAFSTLIYTYIPCRCPPFIPLSFTGLFQVLTTICLQTSGLG